MRLGLLGLTFKAGTNDLRDSPALAVAGLLADAGAHLTAYDPTVPADAHVGPVQVVDDPYAVAKDAARNLLDGTTLTAKGITYIGVGAARCDQDERGLTQYARDQHDVTGGAAGAGPRCG